uniref:Uncharacterized protein n=1 Tax=Arion vulgaris TaxID=1028688 RepID=A0A0B7BF90_9EUPU
MSEQQTDFRTLATDFRTFTLTNARAMDRADILNIWELVGKVQIDRYLEHLGTGWESSN